MIQYDRQQKLLDILTRRGSATIKELSEEVFVSEASVRRDIAALEAGGYVKKVYGGVVVSDYKNSVVPLALRSSDHSQSKERIAEIAAGEVKNGMTILLDASSTVNKMIKYLSGVRDLRIITNSLYAFEEISKLGAGSGEIRAYCTGGEFDPASRAFFGPAAERYINSISADIVFFSSQGLSEEGEISDVYEQETSLRRAMLTRAKRRVFLCDASKLGVRRIFTLCTKEDVDRIICDAPLPWEEK